MICDLKFFIPSVATSINTFWGTLKNGGYSKYRQNFGIFSKIFFISWNTRFSDMQPWDSKVSKVPKETYSRLRIGIGAVHGTCGKLQILSIIVHFLEMSILPSVRNIGYLDRQGKFFLNLFKHTNNLLLAFPESQNLLYSSSNVFMKLSSYRPLSLF